MANRIVIQVIKKHIRDYDKKTESFEEGFYKAQAFDEIMEIIKESETPSGKPIRIMSPGHGTALLYPIKESDR